MRSTRGSESIFSRAVAQRAHPSWGIVGYALLYAPYVLAELAAAQPELSYWIAWSGSFFVLYLVMSGAVRPLPRDRPIRDQILRPVFLTHAIFALYTALSSLPYFMAIHGYYYVMHDSSFVVDADLVARAAAAQRYYVLAHASFATGILLAMNYRATGKWRIRTNISLPALLLTVSVIAYAVAMVANQFGSAGQLTVRVLAVALFSSVLSLASALATGRAGLISINLLLYVLNFATALLSGWKKEIVVVVTLLLIFAFPYYRRTVLTLGPMVLAALLMLLPAFNVQYRELTWSAGYGRAEAARVAASAIRSGQAPIAVHTWNFLTQRASEIGLFVRYFQFTPAQNDFVGLETAERAILAVVPRALWRQKPDLESAAMERAYRNGVIDRGSSVSAKPQFVVDGYLSAGAAGVMAACLLFGIFASLASRLAEEWFGGYLLGTGLVYTSLFSVFWSGNAFEFTVPIVFWSFTVMWLLALSGRVLRVLVPQGLIETPGHRRRTSACAA
jgi:hypothetical protein